MDAHLISIRVKYGESEKRVEVRLQDQIHTLKSCEFHEEISKNKKVRVIFRGKELHDNATFYSVNMQDNDICHVTVTQKIINTNRSIKSSNRSKGTALTNTNSDTQYYRDAARGCVLSSLDMFLVVIMTICILFWMLLFALPEMLLSPSTSVLLIGITTVSSLACFVRVSHS